jgi:hypothetical protein
MHPLAVLARAGQPRGHGALIAPTSGAEGLGRTAMAQPGQDARHHVRGRPQPGAGRVCGGGEGLAPSGPPIARRRAAMPAHVPSPTRSAGGARRVVAAWGLRVPRGPPLEVIWPSQATHVRTDARRTRVCSSAQSRHHGQMGWYPRLDKLGNLGYPTDIWGPWKAGVL